MKRTAIDISIEQHPCDGFTLSTIVNDTYYKQRYMGYTRKEARVEFREYVATEERKSRVFY